MDRNIYTPGEKTGMVLVALLAEGVDRNDFDTLVEELDATSPSSRRAWIEIFIELVELPDYTSPSSRRAWIEMVYVLLSRCMNASPSSRRAWIEI